MGSPIYLTGLKISSEVAYMLWKRVMCYRNAIYYFFIMKKTCWFLYLKIIWFPWQHEVSMYFLPTPYPPKMSVSLGQWHHPITWSPGEMEFHSFLLCHSFFNLQDSDYPLHSLTRAWWKSNPFVSAPPLMHPHADSKQLMFTKIVLSSYSHIFNQSSIWVSRRSQMAWPLPGS